MLSNCTMSARVLEARSSEELNSSVELPEGSRGHLGEVVLPRLLRMLLRRPVAREAASTFQPVLSFVLSFPAAAMELVALIEPCLGLSQNSEQARPSRLSPKELFTAGCLVQEIMDHAELAENGALPSAKDVQELRQLQQRIYWQLANAGDLGSKSLVARELLRSDVGMHMSSQHRTPQSCSHQLTDPRQSVFLPPHTLSSLTAENPVSPICRAMGSSQKLASILKAHPPPQMSVADARAQCDMETACEVLMSNHNTKAEAVSWLCTELVEAQVDWLVKVSGHGQSSLRESADKLAIGGAMLSTILRNSSETIARDLAPRLVSCVLCVIELPEQIRCVLRPVLELLLCKPVVRHAATFLRAHLESTLSDVHGISGCGYLTGPDPRIDWIHAAACLASEIEIALALDQGPARVDGIAVVGTVSVGLEHGIESMRGVQSLVLAYFCQLLARDDESELAEDIGSHSEHNDEELCNSASDDDLGSFVDDDPQYQFGLIGPGSPRARALSPEPFKLLWDSITDLHPLHRHEGSAEAGGTRLSAASGCASAGASSSSAASPICEASVGAGSSSSSSSSSFIVQSFEWKRPCPLGKDARIEATGVCAFDSQLSTGKRQRRA